MKYFINLSNHALTAEQKADAREHFNSVEFVELPETLKRWWGAIPCQHQAITNCDSFEELEGFLEEYRGLPAPSENGGECPEAVAMIAGVGSLCAGAAALCQKLTIVAVEAASERVSTEAVQPDGSVRKTNVFRHACFRDYPTLYWLLKRD